MNNTDQFPSLQFAIKDFVDRRRALKIMQEIVKRKRSEQVVTFSGRPGIGKTYLLREFYRELIDVPELHPVNLSFTGSAGMNFLHVIEKTILYLGQSGFEEVIQTIREAGEMVNIDTAEITRELDAYMANEQAGSGEFIGLKVESGGTFSNNIIRDSKFIGQMITVQLALNGDDARVQGALLSLITNAFHRSLLTVSRERRVVFLIDGWDHIGNQELHDWLKYQLLTWIHDQLLPGVIAIIAGETKLELDEWELELFIPLEVSPLKIHDRLTYFIDKYKIRSDLAKELATKSGGIPYKMRLSALNHSPLLQTEKV